MSEQQRTITEDDLIDYIFYTLYTNLDKNELHFDDDILSPTKLSLDDKQKEHLREIIVSTGLIKPSVGFTKRNFYYLTQQGIQVMKTFKSYSAYTAATIPPAAGFAPNVPMPDTPETTTLKPPTENEISKNKNNENYDSDWAD
jgi:hypothetical protein